ncbi:MAG: regulatory protein RecX [Oscillospiraceae bacterium]|nr:regulatory protein RecX [Oscillospiraceae bacterium]
MMLINIHPSQKEKGRFCLRLDDGRTLTVTENELLSFGLCRGMELSERQIHEVSRSAGKSRASMKAARMVGARPLSKSELVSRLIRKGERADDAEAAAIRMENLGAVDDASYAAVLVRRYADRGYGPAKMKEELYRRGIDRALWEQAMRQAPAPEEIICTYLSLKKRGVDLEDKTERRRLVDALRRRGFSWDQVEDGLTLYRERKSEQPDA